MDREFVLEICNWVCSAVESSLVRRKIDARRKSKQLHDSLTDLGALSEVVGLRDGADAVDAGGVQVVLLSALELEMRLRTICHQTAAAMGW